jgi:hypothetical protein
LLPLLWLRCPLATAGRTGWKSRAQSVPSRISEIQRRSAAHYRDSSRRRLFLRKSPLRLQHRRPLRARSWHHRVLMSPPVGPTTQHPPHLPCHRLLPPHWAWGSASEVRHGWNRKWLRPCLRHRAIRHSYVRRFRRSRTCLTRTLTTPIPLTKTRRKSDGPLPSLAEYQLDAHQLR